MRGTLLPDDWHGTYAAVVLVASLLVAADASAYSVLTHEAIVDASWDAGIRPLLSRRYPRATRDDITKARAYAYGGSVVQDLGYYPFGSHFFTNVVHYVRSGDFIEAMIRDARDLDEYAFALGALAHYTADNTGHPEAVNKAVALMFPKMKAKYGNAPTYVDSPASHIIAEYSFDIVQVASGAYLPESYHSFIGFEVAKPLLERAFHETYGLEMKEVFADEDLAIGSYRRSVSTLIPQLTQVAWRDKQEEIAKLTPGVKADTFVFRYTRQQYEQEFGMRYQRPGPFARFLGLLFKLVPKIGPLKPLAFKTPTPAAEALFAQSFKDTRARYAVALEAVRRGRLDLADTDFDTGKTAVHGEYSLADDTYAELLDRLSSRQFATVSPALRRNIDAFYRAAPERTASRKERRHPWRIQRQLAALRATR